MPKIKERSRDALTPLTTVNRIDSDGAHWAQQHQAHVMSTITIEVRVGGEGEATNHINDSVSSEGPPQPHSQ